MKKALYLGALVIVVSGANGAQQEVVRPEADQNQRFEEKHIFVGHTERLNTISWTRDDVLASGSGDRTVRLWNPNPKPEEGDCLHVLRGENPVKSVSFSLDGSQIAATEGKDIVIWSSLKGERKDVLKGHTSAITSLHWLSENQLVSGAEEVLDGKSIYTWDPQQEKTVWNVWSKNKKKFGNYTVNSAKCSPDGTQLAVGCSNNIVEVWDPRISKCVQTLRGHTGPVNSVSWSPNNLELVSGSSDETLKIWDLRTGSRDTLYGHNDFVTSVCWSQDLDYIASGSVDRTVKIWKPQGAECVQTLTGHDESVTTVAWAAGAQLASGSDDRTVRTWELAPVNPEEKFFDAVDDAESKAEHLVQEFIEKDTKRTRAPVYSVRYSSDGTQFTSADVWDRTTGRKIKKSNNPLFPNAQSLSDQFFSPENHPKGMSLLEFNQSDSTFLSTTGDKIFLWKIESDKLKKVQDYEGHAGLITALSFISNPTGSEFASGSLDNTVRIWKRGSRSVKFDFDQPILSLSCSPDGSRLAAGVAGGTVYVCNLDTLQCLQRLKDYGIYAQQKLVNQPFGPSSQSINISNDAPWSLGWSSNSVQIAVGCEDNLIRIWNGQTGDLLQRIVGHQGPVRSVQYHPTEPELLSGSPDRTIKIWELTQVKRAENQDNVQRVFVTQPSAPILLDPSEQGFEVQGRSEQKQDLGVQDVYELPKITHEEAKAAVEFREKASVKEEANMIYAVEYSPNGVQYAYGTTSSINVKNVELGLLGGQNRNSLGCYSLSWSPHGAQLVFPEGKKVCLWTIPSWTSRTCEFPENVYVVKYHPDGNLFALSSGNNISTCRVVPDRKVVNTYRERVFNRRYRHMDDWERYRYRSYDRDDQGYPIEERKVVRDWLHPLQTFAGHTRLVTSLDFHPNGAMLISGSLDNTISLWKNTQIEGPANRLNWYRHSNGDAVLALKCHPGGQLLASSGAQGVVCTWDMEKNAWLTTLQDLLCFDNREKMLQPYGPYSPSIKVKNNASWSLDWSSDGNLLAAGCEDGIVRVWDNRSGQCVQRLQAHQNAIRSISFHPTRHELLTGSLDCSIKTWEGISVVRPVALAHSEALVPEPIIPRSEVLLERKEEEQERKQKNETQLVHMSEEEHLRRALAESQREAEERKLDEDRDAFDDPDIANEIQRQAGEQEGIDDSRPEGAPLPVAQSAGLLAAVLEQVRPSLNFLQSIVEQSIEQLGPLAIQQTTYLSDNVQEQLAGWLVSLTEDLELMAIKQLVQQERDKYNKEDMSYKVWNEIVKKFSAKLIGKLS